MAPFSAFLFQNALDSLNRASFFLFLLLLRVGGGGRETKTPLDRLNETLQNMAACSQQKLVHVKAKM